MRRTRQEILQLFQILLSYLKKKRKHALVNWFVMNCGTGDNLEDIISHQNIAGNYHTIVIHSSMRIAICMQFLNDLCKIIHRDIKSRFIFSNHQIIIRYII